MKQEERWVNQIEKAIAKNGSPYKEFDGYYKGAWAIVEPYIMLEETVEDSKAYYAFQDANVDAWVGFIKSNFGPEWGLVAEFVRDEGY